MSALQERLIERGREVDVYIRFLTLLERNAALSVPVGEGRRKRAIDERVLKILKANFFLLLYNVVEASIRDAFRELYEAMRDDGCTVRVVTQELRHLWIDAAVDKMKPQTANQDSYRTVTRRLVREAIEDVSTSLNIDDLRFGGNLDATQIRRTCQDHGVRVHAHPRAKGGEKLELVRSRRNDLAHGSLSFSECGRDYTLAQLVEVRREALLFLRGVLRSVERHVSRREYRSA